MERFKWSIISLLLIVALIGNIPSIMAAQVDSAIARGNNDFAINLYKELSSAKDNFLFSPFSISNGFSIVYIGARGSTESQIQKVLHFLPDQNSHHQAYGQILKNYKFYKSESFQRASFNLDIANAVWVEKQYNFLQSFLKIAEANYGSVLFNVDFKNSFESVRKKINKWVEDQTSNNIKDLIGPNVLNSSTRFVITNAIYFSSNWRHSFSKSAISQKDFFVKPSQTVKVQMMSQTENMRYMENESFKMLEMPYMYPGISMYVILPKKIDGLSQVESSLTSELITQSINSLDTKEVVISFPKYRIDSELELNKTLSKIGMSDAFVFGKADFSGINGNKELYISTVIHKTFIDVDEEGTKAAAATAIMGVAGCAMPEQKPRVEFNANHPFIYIIKDTREDIIFFMGRVLNPNG